MKTKLFLAVASFALSLTAPLMGIINITAVESPSGVTISFSGSLDLTGLTKSTKAAFTNGYVASYSANGDIFIAPPSAEPFAEADRYTGSITFYSGNFGINTGVAVPPTSYSGTSIIGIDPLTTSSILVPSGYTSGTISGSNYYEDMTLADLGFSPVPNTYTTSWAADSIVISTSTVPEPTTYAALAGVAVLGLAALRRRKVA